MVITLTSIRLKRLWHYFKLTYLAMHVVRQMKGQAGFIKKKHTGFGYWHYTLSVWESEAQAKSFARAGAHLQAMKAGPSIATEVRIHTFQSDRIPGWKEAKQLLLERGKVIRYR
jgi:heme-degrading monooxygenase HmoA